MLGRAAYQEPWRLLSVDPELFGEAAPHATMHDAIEALMPYIERELAAGTRLHSITRHLVGAFHGVRVRGRFDVILRKSAPSRVPGTRGVARGAQDCRTAFRCAHRGLRLNYG